VEQGTGRRDILAPKRKMRGTFPFECRQWHPQHMPQSLFKEKHFVGDGPRQRLPVEVFSHSLCFLDALSCEGAACKFGMEQGDQSAVPPSLAWRSSSRSTDGPRAGDASEEEGSGTGSKSASCRQVL